MRSRAEVVSLLLDPGLIAVVRAKSAEQVVPLAEALVAGGLIAVEVTLTTPNALVAIREVSKRLAGKAVIGAGTVLNVDQCRAVIAAGAEFVVSPICRREIVLAAHESDRPVMIGAFTPTEAQLAHEAGADFVKLFPADTLGPGYVKSLRAPLPHLRVVPTGGVNLRTIADFLKAGCAALGVGSSLISESILLESRWDELTRVAAEYVAAVRQARQGA